MRSPRFRVYVAKSRYCPGTQCTHTHGIFIHVRCIGCTAEWCAFESAGVNGSSSSSARSDGDDARGFDFNYRFKRLLGAGRRAGRPRRRWRWRFRARASVARANRQTNRPKTGEETDVTRARTWRDCWPHAKKVRSRVREWGWRAPTDSASRRVCIVTTARDVLRRSRTVFIRLAPTRQTLGVCVRNFLIGFL